MLFSSFVIGWDVVQLVCDWLRCCSAHLWLAEMLFSSFVIGSDVVYLVWVYRCLMTQKAFWLFRVWIFLRLVQIAFSPGLDSTIDQTNFFFLYSKTNFRVTYYWAEYFNCRIKMKKYVVAHPLMRLKYKILNFLKIEFFLFPSPSDF